MCGYHHNENEVDIAGSDGNTQSGHKPDQIDVGREAAEPDRLVVAQRHQRLQSRVVLRGFDQLRQEELAVSPL